VHPEVAEDGRRCQRGNDVPTVAKPPVDCKSPETLATSAFASGYAAARPRSTATASVHSEHETAAAMIPPHLTPAPEPLHPNLCIGTGSRSGCTDGTAPFGRRARGGRVVPPNAGSASAAPAKSTAT